MVNSLLNTAQQLKGMIEHAKIQAEAAKDAAITQVKLQAEAEKKEVIHWTSTFWYVTLPWRIKSLSWFFFSVGMGVWKLVCPFEFNWKSIHMQWQSWEVLTPKGIQHGVFIQLWTSSNKLGG